MQVADRAPGKASELEMNETRGIGNPDLRCVNGFKALLPDRFADFQPRLPAHILVSLLWTYICFWTAVQLLHKIVFRCSEVQTKAGGLFGIEQMQRNRSEKQRDKDAHADRRVARTRELLEQALLSLIKEKSFGSISVKDIIERANVGRATFYLHYENKEDLLGSGFAGLKEELRERQRAVRQRGGNFDERLFAFSRYLLEHAHQHREVIPAMVGKRGGAAIQHVLRRLLTDLMREEVRAMSGERGSAGVPAEATVEFLASGLFGLLVWWLNGRMRLSVGEMDEVFRRLAIPALKAGTEHR